MYFILYYILYIYINLFYIYILYISYISYILYYFKYIYIYIILYYIVLYYIILKYIILYYIVLKYIILYYTILYYIILYIWYFMLYIDIDIIYRIFMRDGHCIDPSRPNWISGWFPLLPRPFSRSFVRPSSPRGPSRNKKCLENGWNLERNGKIIRFWVITCDFLGFEVCFFEVYLDSFLWYDDVWYVYFHRSRVWADQTLETRELAATKRQRWLECLEHRRLMDATYNLWSHRWESRFPRYASFLPMPPRGNFSLLLEI